LFISTLNNFCDTIIDLLHDARAIGIEDLYRT